MGEKYFITFAGFFICLVIFLIGYYLRETSKRNIYYGIRIPSEYQKDERLLNIVKSYKRSFLLGFLPFAAIYIILLYFFTNPAILITGVFVLLAVLNANYYMTYGKVRRLKASENWGRDEKDIVIVDTAFRNDKKQRARASGLWFLIPAALIIFNLVIGFYVYDKLPGILPTHWNFKGEADSWAHKSYGTIFALPIVMTVLTALMYGVWQMIGRAKQDITEENIELSRERNRRFRNVWSVFIIIFSILLADIFTFIHLTGLQLIHPSPADFALVIGMMLLLSFVAVVISMVVGQGGSRIELDGEKGATASGVSRNDDKYWILGDFYYNPDDPSLFVEKRVGVGWDLNYARPAAKIIAGVIILLILAVIGLSIYAGIHGTK